MIVHRIKKSLRKSAVGFVFLACFFLYIKREEAYAEVAWFLYRFQSIPEEVTPSYNNVAHSIQKFRPASSHSGGQSNLRGCQLPNLDPWSPDILQYVKGKPVVNCKNSQRKLLYAEMNRLVFNMSAANELGLDRSSLTCTYSYINLVDTDNYKIEPELTMEGNDVTLSSCCTGVYVNCYMSLWSWLYQLLPQLISETLGIIKYRNILIYTPLKVNFPDRVAGETKYSVVTMIIDAFSQMNLIRSLPATMEVLKKSGGFVFKGIHKTGHNSYPNVMSLLSGELGGKWPGDIVNRTEMYYMDEKRQPLTLAIFRKYKYLTMLMEDLQIYGSMYRLGVVGFRRDPVEVYFRGPFLAMWKEEFGWLRNSLVGKADAYSCLQEELIHVFQIRALGDFLHLYRNVPYWSHLHLNEYTHNDLNMGKLYDKDLSIMLERLTKAGDLNNTFFILMGDHGYQRGEDRFTLTSQGKIENNMPAFALIPPPDFKINHPEKYKNLLKNSKTLTSFFDVNQMLRDILVMANSSAKEDLRKLEGHGTSLFKDIGERSCKEAEVKEAYCSCTEGVIKLNESRKDLQDLASAALKDRQSVQKDFGFCQPLVLKKIKSAISKEKDGLFTIKLQIEVEARGAIFDLIVTTDENGLQNVQLIRLDWYSSTSGCVPEELDHIRPYCICPG